MTSPRRLQPGSVPSSRCIAMSDKRSGILSAPCARHLANKICSRGAGAMCAALFGVIIGCALPDTAAAQFPASASFGGQKLLASADDSNGTDWKRFVVGFGASIIAHEGAHVLSS